MMIVAAGVMPTATSVILAQATMVPTIRTAKAIGRAAQMSSDGWKAPATDLEVQQQFFGKHGDDSYTREIDRRWRIMGKLIEKGSRIRDGRLVR